MDRRCRHDRLSVVQPLVTWTLDGQTLILRRAARTDVAAIVELLVADQLGTTRDGGPDLDPYYRAFAAIDTDPAQLLLVVTTDDGTMVGTAQVTFIPGLARRGALRAQVEAVRIAAGHRSRGLGQAMLSWTITEARRRGWGLVQLTTDKTRTDAHRFYQRFGFTASHEGLKLYL